MKPWRLVSYFTRGTGYEVEVRKLIASCDKLKIPNAVLPVANRGSWQKNTQLKAEFILDMLDLQAPSGQAVVWVDADAVVRQYPALFDALECDLGLSYRDYAKFPCGKHRSGEELLSGTIYLANNEVVRQLVKDWIRQNAAAPGLWEQRNLQAVVERWGNALRVQRLPPTYCKIFDTMRTAGPGVIEHYQASRRFRQKINRTQAIVEKAKRGGALQINDLR